MSGTITQITKAGSTFVWTLNVTAHSENPIDWPDFVNGTLSVSWGTDVPIIAANGPSSQLTTSAMAIRCEVYDDDNGSMLNPPLPKLPDVSTMVSAYAPAYVLPVFDVGDNNLSVPFILNAIDIQDAYDWDSRSQNTTTFWVAYLLTAYQPYAVDDGDPNSEFSPLGLTPSQEGGSLILLELHQLHEGIADPTTEERDTVVHESGHSAGDDTPADPDHAELGIMTEGAPITQSSFSASTLRRFREANPW